MGGPCTQRIAERSVAMATSKGMFCMARAVAKPSRICSFACANPVLSVRVRQSQAVCTLEAPAAVTIWHELALDCIECQVARCSAGSACERDELVAAQRLDSPMTFRPLHDRVLVRRIEAPDRTASGIIIPDNAREKPQEGEVIAVGVGIRAQDGALVSLDVKPGDRILFGKWSGTDVKISDEDLIIMKESDVLGILG